MSNSGLPQQWPVPRQEMSRTGKATTDEHGTPDSAIRSRIDTRIRAVLKEAREDSDVSQKALGRALNLTRNQIANLESGQRTVRVADLVMIAIALGFEPEKILRHALHGAAASCPHCQERARRRGGPESDLVALLRKEMRI